MNLKLSVSNQNEANIMVLVFLIGVLEALEKGIISIDESQDYIFTPYSIRVLNEKGIDKRIIEIIEHGCELEDIQSLLPDKVGEKIKSLKSAAEEQLKSVRQFEKNYEVKKWIDEE